MKRKKKVKLTVDLSSSSCLVQTAQSTAPVLSSPMCRGTARARRSTNPGRWFRRGKWKNASCSRRCRVGFSNLHTSRSGPVRCEGCAMPLRRKDGDLLLWERWDRLFVAAVRDLGYWCDEVGHRSVLLGVSGAWWGSGIGSRWRCGEHERPVLYRRR